MNKLESNNVGAVIEEEKQGESLKSSERNQVKPADADGEPKLINLQQIEPMSARENPELENYISKLVSMRKVITEGHFVHKSLH